MQVLRIHGLHYTVYCQLQYYAVYTDTDDRNRIRKKFLIHITGFKSGNTVLQDLFQTFPAVPSLVKILSKCQQFHHISKINYIFLNNIKFLLITYIVMENV
jgi:hypothetical protein